MGKTALRFGYFTSFSEQALFVPAQYGTGQEEKCIRKK